MEFATKQIHGGKQANQYGALVPPVYQTATFGFETVQQGGARFNGSEVGYVYTRPNNPSCQYVEDKMALLEEGEAAVATASGMGAISATLWSILHAGDEIVASDTLYGCTFELLTHGLVEFGISVKLVDMTDPDKFKKSLSDKTKVVYFESPCNPNMKIIDIQAISNISHEFDPDIKVIVDNTFASPYLTRPLTLGADIVVHSATKYINGHGDVIAGFIIGTAEFVQRVKTFGLKDMTGAVMSPFNAFLVARGLKTLDIRMERHCSNAMKLAEFLDNHPAIEKVYYPGLKDFEGHDIAMKQMALPGAMISIEIKGGKDVAASAVNKLKLCTIAVSLGDAETLVEHPATMTHSTYTPEELAASGISEGLVRISVGLEGINDLIEDFRQALEGIA